jgi:hypothetical protein
MCQVVLIDLEHRLGSRPDLENDLGAFKACSQSAPLLAN